MKMDGAKVLVAGLMVMDILVKPVSPALFETDSSFVDSMDFLTGGDAMNVAVNLSKLGLNVYASGLVGYDVGGKKVIEDLDRHNINRDLVEIRGDVTTTVSMVMCEKDGERHFVCLTDSTKKYDGHGLMDGLDGAKAVYIGSMMALPGLENGVLRRVFAEARRRGIITAMDATASPDERWLERIEDVLEYTDVFIPSEGEAVRITGETDPVKCAAFLRARGVKIAGVKLGARGCYIDDGKEPFFLPAMLCEHPVDLTGAGDAFMSGFMYGVLQGWSTRESAKFATATSYNCIQSLGASTHKMTADSIRSLVLEHENREM